jgi:hypothetical protein
MKSRYTGIKGIFNFLPHLMFLLPALFAFTAQRVFVHYPAFVETIFSTHIYRIFSYPISFLSSLVPFSLTELSFTFLIPVIILLMIFFIRKLKKTEKPKKTILRTVKLVGWVLSVAYLVFMIQMGFNYTRTPINVTMGIDIKERSVDELKVLCTILAREVNRTRMLCEEDEKGNMILSQDLKIVLRSGHLGYNQLNKTYFFIHVPPRRVKGVLFSRRWSYTGTVGMYFPFYAEANVNTDVPDSSIPSAMMHELAHMAGFARENEAEFVGFLTGINHPDHDFQYSSYLNSYIHAINALYSTDRKAYTEISAQLSDPVKQDLQQRRDYWKQFEGKVREVSTQVNHTYLQVNLQNDGVKSYGRVVDLLLGYYLN